MNERMAGEASANGCGDDVAPLTLFVRARISETNTDVYETS